MGRGAAAAGALLVVLASVVACGLLFPTVLEEATGEARPDGSMGDGAPSTDGPVGGDGGSVGVDGADARSSDGAPCEASTTGPHNCGRCGHDCLGGSCDGGGCQPVVLVGNQSSPQFVAVGTNTVYWTNFGDSTRTPLWGDGALRRIAKDGTGASDLVSPAPSAYQLVSDGQLLYFDLFYSGYVQSVDPASGQALPTKLWGRSRPFPTGLALSTDGGALYWLGTVDDGGVSVYVATLPTGPPSKLTFDTDDQFGLGLAVDSTQVYFTAGMQNRYSGAQNVKRIGVAGCADGGACGVTVYSDFNLNALAVDGSYLYVADAYAGAIVRVPKAADGGAPVMMATGLNNPSFLLLQGGWLYWVESVGLSDGGPGGAIGRIRPDGTQSGRLVVHQSFPLGLAVDGTVLYWANQGTVTSTGRFDNHDGQIVRLVL